MALRVSLTNLSLLLVIIFVFICLLCLQLLQSQHHALRFASAFVHLAAEYKPIESTKANENSRHFNMTEKSDHMRTYSARESFSTEVNHYKYRPNRDFQVQLQLKALVKYANGASTSKGRYVEYHQADLDMNRSHTSSVTELLRMFRYDHSTPLCYRHYISLKYTPECGQDHQLDSMFIKPLLIVAVQRSGTHYMWEMLQRLQIDVHHEGVGPDGAVSWLYAVNAHANHTTDVYEFGKGYAINNPEVLYKNRFRHIFQQVRHPLRVITTLCNRCAEFDIFWRWIHNLKGFQQIKPEQTPLRRAMLLYLLWNKHIEKYADLRYQSEVTSPRDVCLWAGFPASRCMLHYTTRYPTNSSTIHTGNRVSTNATSEPDTQYYSYSAYSVTAVVNKDTKKDAQVVPSSIRRLTNISHSSDALPHQSDVRSSVEYSNNTTQIFASSVRAITWSDLDKEDLALANEIRVMCLEYGYSLDPDLTPQRIETKQFTA